MAVALLTTGEVESVLREAVDKGCYVEHSESDGTARAYPRADISVFQAIQKGKAGPWICQFVGTERITWTSTAAD